jgi:hypothetical protein
VITRLWRRLRAALARFAAEYQRELEQLSPEEQADYLRRQNGHL